MRIFGQSQPSDAESIKIRVYMTSKCRVHLATYTANSFLVCIANLKKKSGHNDKLSLSNTVWLLFA